MRTQPKLTKINNKRAKNKNSWKFKQMKKEISHLKKQGKLLLNGNMAKLFRICCLNKLMRPTLKIINLPSTILTSKISTLKILVVNKNLILETAFTQIHLIE